MIAGSHARSTDHAVLLQDDADRRVSARPILETKLLPHRMKAVWTHAVFINATIGPAGASPWRTRARLGCCPLQGVADAEGGTIFQAPERAPCPAGAPGHAADGLQKIPRISNVSEAREIAEMWRGIGASRQRITYCNRGERVRPPPCPSPRADR